MSTRSKTDPCLIRNCFGSPLRFSATSLHRGALLNVSAVTAGRDALEEYLELNNQQIDEIVKMVRGKLSTQNRITLQVSLIAGLDVVPD